MKNIFISIFALAIFFYACNQADNQSIAEDKLISGDKSVSDISQGEQLFDTKCMICHLKTAPTKAQFKSLSAPPITAVAFHVKRAYSDSNKVMDVAAAKAFILDYVFFPDASKVLCNAERIKSFGIMPSLKGSVTEEEVDKISDYIFANFPLAGPYKPTSNNLNENTGEMK